jgi:transposase-like protein
MEKNYVDLKEQALQMIRDGITGVEVAKRLGVHKDTIRKWRKDAGLSGSSAHRRMDPDVKKEAITQMREGVSDYSINKSLGVARSTLRRWRKKEGIAALKKSKTYTIEQLNNVIDLIREGYIISDITRETGVSAKKISEWHKEEIRNGNPLPEIRKALNTPTQKYSDEELIELTFLNQGYGFREFTKFLGVKENFVMDLFIQFKEMTNGQEDPLAFLQDPSNHIMVSEAEYRKITGRKYLPLGKGRTTGKRVQGENKGTHVKIQLPPQEFAWGPYSRKEWHVKNHPAHELEGNMSTDEWIERRIHQNGFVRFNEDAEEFSKSTGSGASRTSFNKWMKRAGLHYDNRYGYWCEGNHK